MEHIELKQPQQQQWPWHSATCICCVCAWRSHCTVYSLTVCLLLQFLPLHYIQDVLKWHTVGQNKIYCRATNHNLVRFQLVFQQKQTLCFHFSCHINEGIPYLFDRIFPESLRWLLATQQYGRSKWIIGKILKKNKVNMEHDTENILTGNTHNKSLLKSMYVLSESVCCVHQDVDCVWSCLFLHPCFLKLDRLTRLWLFPNLLP